MEHEPDTCDLLCARRRPSGETCPRLEVLEKWAAGAKALADPICLAVTLALAR